MPLTGDRRGNTDRRLPGGYRQVANGFDRAIEGDHDLPTGGGNLVPFGDYALDLEAGAGWHGSTVKYTPGGLLEDESHRDRGRKAQGFPCSHHSTLP
jgi:hypothetical protein